MRLAIFGDIHGDWESLQRVLAAIDRKQPDRLICLGDIPVHGPDSQRCVGFFRAHPEILAVQGNHDLGASLPDEQLANHRFFSRAGRKHTLEARAQLAPEDRQYLAHLPRTAQLAGVSFAHATWTSPFTLLFDCFAVAQALGEAPTDVLFAGHTHRTMVHRQPAGSRIASFRPLITGRPVCIEPGARYLINVGNVAQLRYDKFPPVFALYDQERREVTFHELLD